MLICKVVWLITLTVCIYDLYITSQNVKYNVKILEHLDKGWYFLNSHKDSSDTDWHDIKQYLNLKWWFVGHTFLCLACKYCSSHTKKIIYICYGFSFIITTMAEILLLILFNIVTVFIMSLKLSSKVYIWIATVAQMLIIDSCYTSLSENSNDYNLVMQYCAVAYTGLRCIYFGGYIMESAEFKRENKSCIIDEAVIANEIHTEKTGVKTHDKWILRRYENYHLDIFIDCLCYCLYMPLLTFGQLIPFDDFKMQINLQTMETFDVNQLIKKITRILLWSIFMETSLHYIYAFALSNTTSLLWEIPLLSVVGTAYWISQLFTVKYVILWSFTSMFAQFDGLTTPPLPQCTSKFFYISSIWRNFDSGLYTFVKRNIYIPLGGSREGLKRRIAAYTMAFIFLTYWHGMSPNIVVWTVLCYFSMLLEMVGVHFLKGRFAKQKLEFLECLMSLVNLMVFSLGTLSFLGNMNLSTAFFYRVFIEGFPVSTATFLLVIYCALSCNKKLFHSS